MLINQRYDTIVCPQLESIPSLALNGSKARNAVYETKNTILLKDCSSYSITDENGGNFS